MRYHEPVLAGEVVARIRVRPGGVLCDGTLGSAGHALVLLPQLEGRGTFVGLDRDPEMLERARERLKDFEAGGVRMVLEAARYERLPEILKREGIASVDGVLLDLGINSLHVSEEFGHRGFSFAHEGVLDGRFDPSEPGTMSIERLVNEASEATLAGWLYELADERHARAIARAIVRERTIEPIRSTRRLAEIVWGCYPPRDRHQGIHPATRTWQALRIVANDELGCVERGVRACVESLSPGGTCVVLSYHSGEDRTVKRLFDEYGSPRPDPSNPYSATTLEGVDWRVESRGALKPSEAEVAANPRARSARLRAIVRVGGAS